MFSITVDDPQRVGSPIGAYTMYTVHTRVSRSFHFELREIPMHSPRQLPLCSADQPSPSSVDTQTFYGFTKRFPRITQVSLFPQYRRRTPLADSMTNSSNNGGWPSKGVYKRQPTILSCKRIQISNYSWRAIRFLWTSNIGKRRSLTSVVD